MAEWNQYHFTEEEKLDMKEKYESGWTLEKIANIHGCSYNTIRSRLVDMGVKIRKGGNVKKQKIYTEKREFKTKREQAHYIMGMMFPELNTVDSYYEGG